MEVSVREMLAGITTVPDMVKALHDENHCRRLLEAIGYRRSIALTGRENGKRSRLGLY